MIAEAKQLADAQNLDLAALDQRSPVLAERDRVCHDHLFQIRITDILDRLARQHAVRKAREYVVGTRLVQCLGNLADRAARVAHVVDDQTIFAVERHRRCSSRRPRWPARVAYRKEPSPASSRFAYARARSAPPVSGATTIRFSIGFVLKYSTTIGAAYKVIDRNIKKPLYLRRVQIDRQNSLCSGRCHQIRDQLCRDRHTRTVLFIRPCVTKIRNDRRYSLRRCSDESVDHYQQFHQVPIGRRTCRLHDEHIASRGHFHRSEN